MPAGRRHPIVVISDMLLPHFGIGQSAALAYAIREELTEDGYTITDSGDRSCRWPRPVIHTDPAVNGGRPCIHGVPVSAIAGRVAAGEPLAEVAADVGLTRRDALTACWHAAAWDDDYAGWAEEWIDAAWTGLGMAPDDDSVCDEVPDPPPLADQSDYAPVMTTIDVIGGLL